VWLRPSWVDWDSARPTVSALPRVAFQDFDQLWLSVMVWPSVWLAACQRAD